MGGLAKSAVNPNNSARFAPQTPPRKPSDLSKSMIITSSPANQSQPESKQSLLAQTNVIKPESFEKTNKNEIIPTFWSPDKKPSEETPVSNADLNLIKEYFMMGRRDLDADGLKPLLEKLIEIPVYFSPIIIEKYGKNKQLSKDSFLQAWKNELAKETPIKRSFKLLDNGDKGYLIKEDFSS
jgi:hypothetical protein